MNSVMKWTLITLGAFVVVGVTAAGGLMVSLGGFNTVDEKYAGSCYRVDGVVGAEDIEADYRSGLAYISSDDRWAYGAGNKVPGAIYKLDMNADAPGMPVRMTGTEGLKDFHPHGISFYQDASRKMLFVISHRRPEAPANGHDIYAFTIEGDGLVLENTFVDVGFRSPNDLTVVGPQQFYLTNDRLALDADGALVEILLGLERSDITFFDGTSSRIVAGDLAFANGIRLSADGLTLYATAFRGGATYVYQRDPLSNMLALQEVIPTGTGPDNISLAPDGALWITEHPNILASTAHGSDPMALSPARVYRLDPALGTSEVVYEDTGELISGASVAVPFDTKFLIGAIFQEGVLVCQK